MTTLVKICGLSTPDTLDADGRTEASNELVRQALRTSVAPSGALTRRKFGAPSAVRKIQRLPMWSAPR